MSDEWRAIVIIVIGPIANDDVRTQFVKHMLGEITEIELMENLKWKRCTYQYCFISVSAAFHILQQ